MKRRANSHDLSLLLCVFLATVASATSMTLMQSSFTGGELSPLAAARIDAERYYTCLAELTNMVAIPQGPAVRRPGTVYVGPTDANQACRLIPFRYSADDVYVLAFTDLTMQVCREHGRVTDDDDSIYELVTPFDANEIDEIQVVQNADVMWLLDGTDWPQKLVRTDHNDWSIADAPITDGPFLDENLTGATIAADAVTGDVNLVASAATFEADDVGGLWRLRDLVEVQSSNGTFNEIDDINTPSDELILQSTNNFQWTLSGNWVGTAELQISYDDGVTWAAYTVFSSTGSSSTTETVYDNDTGQDLLVRAALTAYTSGSVTYNLWVHATMHTGAVEITAYTDPCNVTATVVRTLASTDATVRWSEGAWSPARGYPSAVATYNDRLVVASTTHQPLNLWFSATGEYDSFDVGEGTDADAFGYQLGRAEQDPILWLAAQRRRGLIAGTSGSLFEVGPMDESIGITPNNLPTITNTLAIGCADVAPVVADNLLLVLQRGGRKLREVLYSYEADALVAPDLTLFAEHVTTGGLTAMAWTNQPYTLLWAARADGTLIGFTYDRNYQVVAWGTHSLGGDGVVESLCVVPGSGTESEDELWLAVARTVDANTVRYIEYLSPWACGDDPCDQVFVDSAISYDDSAATTFAGIGHLEACSIAGLADGGPVTGTVAEGQVTLANSATTVHLGLAYTSTLRTVRYDLAGQQGATWGRPKAINHAVISFYQTLGASVGPDSDHLFEPSWRIEGAPILGGVPDLFTGDRRIGIETSYSTDAAELSIIQKQPWPMTVRAIVPTLEIH